jgi:hypothetical protein
LVIGWIFQIFGQDEEITGRALNSLCLRPRPYFKKRHCLTFGASVIINMMRKYSTRSNPDVGGKQSCSSGVLRPSRKAVIKSLSTNQAQTFTDTRPQTKE